MMNMLLEKGAVEQMLGRLKHISVKLSKRERLQSGESPKIVLVNEISLTSTGKINKLLVGKYVTEVR